MGTGVRPDVRWYGQGGLSDDAVLNPSEATKIKYRLKRALLMLTYNVVAAWAIGTNWGVKALKRPREQPLNIAVRLFQLKERQRLDIQLKVMQFFYESTAGKYFAPS